MGLAGRGDDSFVETYFFRFRDIFSLQIRVLVQEILNRKFQLLLAHSVLHNYITE